MASPLFPAAKFQIQQQIFDPKSNMDELNFYNQRFGSPSELTSIMTYILGDFTKNYPLSTMTMGGEVYGNRSVTEVDDVQYHYPIMGRDTKASIVAPSQIPYGSGDKPGVSNSTFFIDFTDNWIKKQYVISSTNQVLAYVVDSYALPTGGYRYTVQLVASQPGQYCPISELQPGTRWIELFTAVTESNSRTTESVSVAPAKYKNQLHFLRHGIQWAGNAANKVMNIKMKTSDGNETNMWMDFIMWQFERQWLDQKEHALWYSRYNRLADGSIPLINQYNQKEIPTCSGLLEQIVNKSTYGRMTYDLLVNKIGDALFAQQDRAGMSITLMTGTGGFREFNRAMLQAGATLLGNAGFGGGNIADKFVSGSGYNLALGGFFDTMWHVDGYLIKVKKVPLFDSGKVAQASPLHPLSGLPLESYRMVFIDDNDNDGQPNIMHVGQKNRLYTQAIIKGLAPIPRGILSMAGSSSKEIESSLINAASDEDASQYTRLASCGIQILRPNACFDLQCKAGLPGYSSL